MNKTTCMGNSFKQKWTDQQEKGGTLSCKINVNYKKTKWKKPIAFSKLKTMAVTRSFADGIRSKVVFVKNVADIQILKCEN